MPNPRLSLWLSPAYTWAGAAARSFWTAEMCRQQTAVMNEMARQIMRLGCIPDQLRSRTTRR
jgi:hypothetical protein